MRQDVSTVAALAILAMLAVGSFAFFPVPVSAQIKSVPVRNALVILSPQGQSQVQAVLGNGGTPSGIEHSLEQLEHLLQTKLPRSYTDQNGSFSISAPGGAGLYNISISAPGFVAAASGGNSINAGGSRPANLTLVVQPSAVLTGRVTDSQGSPLGGIVVAAGDQPNSANHDVTTDDGIFVLDTGFLTGTYVIHAFKPDTNNGRFDELFSELESVAGNPHSSSDMNLGGITNASSKLVFRSDAQARGFQPYNGTVSLEQGKLTTLNIQLNDSKVISGTISGKSDGKPIPGIGVLAFDAQNNLAATAVTNSSGQYVFDNNIRQGDYRVVIPSGLSGYFAPASHAVSVPSPEENSTNFALAISRVITGKVVDRNGLGISNATVIAASENADRQLGDLGNLIAGIATSKTGPDGVFRLDAGLAAGSYIIAAYYGDALPVSGNAIVDASRGDGTTTIRLDYSDIVKISGTVTNNSGIPLENARILPSFATSVPGSTGFAAVSGHDGAFVMTVPIKDASARSLFDQIVVSAPGYSAGYANITDANSRNVSVVLSKSQEVFAGRVVTQISSSMPLESALARQANITLSGGDSENNLGIKTNTKVTSAAFDKQNKEIILGFEGMQGPGGASELTIPASLLSAPFAVLVDGRPLEASNVTITEKNNTYAVISFRHDHGLGQVIVMHQDSQVVPEFPNQIALAIAGLSIIILPAAIRMRRRKYSAQ